MKTTLVFDYDKSMASIGDDKTITKLLGIPPIRITKGMEETVGYIKKLIKPVIQRSAHPVFTETEVETESFQLNKKASELNLQVLVFDTISALGLQERQELKKKKKLETMDQRGWGIYGDQMNSFIYKMCSLPITVIMTAHIDHDKDSDGYMFDYPAVKGSSKNEIQKWFDVILYTRISKDKDKPPLFLWQTKPDERRFAKDRAGVLNEFMEQDLSVVLEKYAQRGITSPKILILGESGTGKTKSLVTINKVSGGK